jgi:hypothetical protein
MILLQKIVVVRVAGELYQDDSNPYQDDIKTHQEEESCDES